MRLHIVPWTLEGLDLGANLLELGPGYGASTDLLLPRCQTLTSVEYDPRLAQRLRDRMRKQAPEGLREQPPEQAREEMSEGCHPERSEGPAVSRPATIEASPSERTSGEGKLSILRGDAADLKLPAAEFDSTVCFMMLHHVIPAPRQDRLFAEAFRVLRPGGLFAGADSPAGPLLSLLHLGDKVAMVDPNSLPNRLQAAGFVDVQVDRTRYAFRFRARKPTSGVAYK